MTGPLFLAEFGRQFFSADDQNKPVSQEIQNWMHQLAIVASPRATTECVRSFSETNFRTDLSVITIPVLIIHGNDDKIVPINITSDVTSSLLPNSEYHVIEGASHGVFLTHKDEINKLLLNFL